MSANFTALPFARPNPSSRRGGYWGYTFRDGCEGRGFELGLDRRHGVCAGNKPKREFAGIGQGNQCCGELGGVAAL